MWNEQEADVYLEKVLTNLERIKPFEVTVLTGANGSGKSLVRKVLPQRMAEELNIPKERVIGSTSMERRMGTPFLSDSPWQPTSMETWNQIRQILNQLDRYIVIDEPEIGTDEDVQMAIIGKINDAVKEVYDKGDFKGCLIITHSKLFVRLIRHHQFINLNGLSEDEWLDRLPVRADLEELKHNTHELKHNTHELFLAVERRIKANKDK